MNDVRIFLRLDRNQLRNAVRQMQSVTEKLPCQVLNRALFSAAIRARKAMPVVPISRIDSELGAAITLQTKRGGGFKRAKRTQILEGGMPGENSSAPFVALIINAQVKGSRARFNELTNFAYARLQSPFKGVSRAAGAQAMRGAVNRFLRARHKSSGFFRTCAWAIQLLFQNSDRGQANPAIPPITDSGAPSTAIGSISSRIGKIAGGEVAVGNRARASFWVSGTSADTKNGLFKIAEPVWQKALDDEAKYLRDKAAEIYAKSLKKLGFTVK